MNAKKDRRVLDETTGEWLVKMIVMIMFMFVFTYGAVWLAAHHGLPYVIGMATAIIMTELHSLKGAFRFEKEKDAKK